MLASICIECGLWRGGTISVKMPMWGEGKRGILVMGEAPGEEEDKEGRPFVGRSGRYLRRVLEDFGIDLDRDCWVVNAVRCRPAGNRAPTDKEIMYCRRIFDEDWNRIKNDVKLVLLFGSSACKSFLGEGDVMLLRGRVIPDLKRGVWVGVTVHPSYVLRAANYDGYIEKLFRKDISKALGVLGEKVMSLVSSGFRYEVVRNKEGLRKIVNEVEERGFCAVDFETSVLRPYRYKWVRGGVRVLCVGIGTDRGVWVVDERDVGYDVVRSFLEYLCGNERVVKVVHDGGMEFEWLMVYYGIEEVKNWDDTMLMSYVCDERKGAHGLKFLGWVEFGIRGYEKKVEDFIEGRMEWCPKELLWEYNAWDVWLTVWLWKLYRGKIYRNYRFVYEEILKKSLEVFVRSQVRGCRIDLNYVKFLEDKMKKEIEERERDLRNIARKYGCFNIDLDSAKQVSELLYGKMGLGVLKKTKTGMGSTSEEVLMELKDMDKSGFVEKLLEYRMFVKVLSTYVKGMEEFIVDGRVHPRYSLCRTVTGRVSCSEPNVQNIPKRNMKEVRNMFVCFGEDEVILANDYSQWEVRVVQMYARDMELGRVIREGIDVHGEYTKKIFGIDEGQGLWDEVRKDVKGGFVFASIYGAGVDTVLKNLRKWFEYFGMFRRVEDMREYVREMQKDFFERFHGVREWQERLRRDYERRGYIETLFGRRRRAPIEYTQLINTPVQSAASDFTLLSMVRIYERLGLVPVFMIHDDLTYVVKENEVIEIAREIKKCMCEWDFEFVNVPIEVEQKVGKRWGEIEELKV